MSCNVNIFHLLFLGGQTEMTWRSLLSVWYPRKLYSRGLSGSELSSSTPPPPPFVIATPKYGIDTVPTPTVA